jgi:hypothetical protein
MARLALWTIQAHGLKKKKKKKKKKNFLTKLIKLNV